MKAPEELLKKPLADLVKYLVEGTTTELQKIRVIYRWITAQNPTKLSGSSSDGRFQTPLDYLVAIQAKRTSYHRLMEDMCRYVAEG